ncbi:MAG: restriction endonuclease [Planctomycetes bacterium]|nr:restriction endonuclease [Planctomycetota bacterium]
MQARAETKKAQTQFLRLQRSFDKFPSEIREDSVLLPSLVRWAETLEEERDEAIASALEWKKRPAYKGAEETRIARSIARQAKREFRLAMNRVDFYESLAPWLAEYTDLTVSELIDAMREEEEAKASAERGEDPLTLWVPKIEWKKLSPPERNQKALDRYCDPERRRTPWAAGIDYERYVGYMYEQSGFAVEYRGATRGREDQGIDLICEDRIRILIIQCKRLSLDKELPVRENTVAQIYGSAEFHRMCSDKLKPVRPVLVTTYQLSDEARRFAEHLKVEVKEFFKLKPHPMIKCNISHIDGEKIYHLPMDQQYDRVIVGDREGEFYASTVEVAESAGFRRAFRWMGSDSRNDV